MHTTPEQSHDRAVSSVIGVVLMIALVVILAAVVAVFALELGDGVDDSGPTQAGVTIETDHQERYVQVEVTTLGSADYVNVTGDPYDHLDASGSDLERDDLRELETGDTVRVTLDELEDEGYDGRATAVAVDSDGESVVVTRKDYDLT